jgi:succinate-acetate transporter protein
VNAPAQEHATAELERRAEESARVVVRPLGSPVALGFGALAAATFVVAGLQLGWVAQTEGKKVALALILFSFPAQLLAGVLSFLARDGVVGTAMTELALIWLVVGATLRTSAPGSTSGALGLFLLFAFTTMTVSALVTMQSKLVATGIFATAALRFLLTGVYELGGGKGWQDAAGVFGLALALLALYGAVASELEEALRKPVLPLGRRGEAKAAVAATRLGQSVRQAASEPGVRSRL